MVEHYAIKKASCDSIDAKKKEMFQFLKLYGINFESTIDCMLLHINGSDRKDL